MMVSRLLKSCAMLPASRPTLSSFCDLQKLLFQPLPLGNILNHTHYADRLRLRIEKHPPPAGKPTFLAIINAQRSILVCVVPAIFVMQGILQCLRCVVAVGRVETHAGRCRR